MSDDIIKRLREAIAEHPLSPIHGYAADIAALLALLDKAERERDALSAEAANARQLATAVCNALGVAIMHDAPNAIDLLREDAERYRWLRGSAEIPEHSTRWARWEIRRWDGRYWNTIFTEQVDAAIDAARAAEKGKE